jgi:hypothetical protein
MAANAVFDVSQVQLEIGSTATPFENRLYGTELALCQRYYYRWSSDQSTAWAASGLCRSATSFTGQLAFPVTMRATPTMPDVGAAAANWYVYSSTTIVANALPASASTNNSPNNATITISATGLTAGQGALLYSVSASNYLGFSAEL